MSQFPAQAAFAPAAQGARRNAPVDIPSGTGIPAVQPSNVGAPGIPGVAILPAPVPDLSAARDLEQALRATQALGNTLVDVGNAVNIQRQIDERKSVYEARLQFEKDSLRFEDDFAAGKYNGQIDATDDAEAFVGAMAGRWYDPMRSAPPQDGERLTAAEMEYRERMGKLAGTAWVRRRGEKQKLDFQGDIRAVHAGLVDPTEAGPEPDAETRWGEFAQRYPWLDRATFMEAAYSKSLEALARSGDEQGFARVADMITSEEDRTIFVEPLRKTLADAVKSRRVNQLAMADLAMKEAVSSNSPFVSRWAQLNDSLNSTVEDPGVRESTMIDFFSEEIKQTRSEGDLAASDAMAKMHLSPEGYAELSRRKEALAAPVLTKVLKAYASDPAADFAEYADSVMGRVDPDDFQAAADARVRTVKADRKSRVLTEYLKTGDRGTIEAVMDESFGRWDGNVPAWKQIDGAIDGDEFLDLTDALDKVDASRAEAATAEDILARRTILQPGDAKWDAVLSRAGAMRNGKIMDPQVAAAVIENTQTVPAKMLDALYSGLRTPGPEQAAAIETLASIAPLLENPDSAARINGFALRPTDAGANRATISAMQTVLPMLARLERGPDGRFADQDLRAATEVYQAAVERAQESQPPLGDDRRLEDLLRVGGIDEVGRTSTKDAQTGTVTVTGYRNAVKTESASRLSRAGLGNDAAVELADIVASRVLAQSYPAIGNVGLSKEVIGDRIDAEVAAVKEQYHLPTVGGRGFPAPVEKVAAPMAKWDEAAVTARLAELNIKPDSITHVFPSIGDGNTWSILYRPSGKGETSKFVRIDLPVAPQASMAEPAAVTIEERIRRAREKRSERKPRPWYAPNAPIITGP